MSTLQMRASMFGRWMQPAPTLGGACAAAVQLEPAPALGGASAAAVQHSCSYLVNRCN